MLGGAWDALQLYGIDRLEIAFHDADCFWLTIRNAGIDFVTDISFQNQSLIFEGFWDVYS
jgi:hypothetical protein